MAYLTSFYTNSLSNQNITSALLVGTITNTTRVRKFYINVDLDQVAGNGDYIAYLTVQRAGAGSAYETIRTTKTAASGVTAINFATMAVVTNSATDVIKVYVIGLAGDTTTPDITVTCLEELPALAGDQMDLVNAPNSTAVTAIQNGLATSSSLTTLINRVGAFTGSGVNTVLGFLKSLASKTATLPSDIGGTFDPATDSLEAIVDGQGGGATPATFWAYSNRTLTQTAAQVATAVNGSDLTIYRDSTVSFTLTGLTDFTGWTKLWFTAKNKPETDTDAESVVQLLVSSPASGTTDGLLYINGAAQTKANGSITVNSVTSITVTISAAAAASLPLCSGVSYGVKVLLASSVVPVSEGGTLTVLPVTTKAAS